MSDDTVRVPYLGQAPNIGKKRRADDYQGLPDLRNRTKKQRVVAGRKGSAEAHANKAKITLVDPPWLNRDG